jgi:hypothetical protein
MRSNVAVEALRCAVSSPPGRPVCAPEAVTNSQLAGRLTNTEMHHVDVKEIGIRSGA